MPTLLRSTRYAPAVPKVAARIPRSPPPSPYRVTGGFLSHRPHDTMLAKIKNGTTVEIGEGRFPLTDSAEEVYQKGLRWAGYHSAVPTEHHEAIALGLVELHRQLTAS